MAFFLQPGRITEQDSSVHDWNPSLQGSN